MASKRIQVVAPARMDWRHMAELLAAGQEVFSSLKNLCIWNKTNGGMGSFYRSKHELVFVFKVGTARTLTPSVSATAAATAPMYGTMPGSTRCGQGVARNWPRGRAA
jgi:hypothetical protein